MFSDEARFGRISNPKSCWSNIKVRPLVYNHFVREYRYTYGAVDPLDGEHFFIVAPTCNTQWTSAFLSELSKAYPNDYLILVMDNAVWHKSKSLVIPDNVELVFIPPYTPEMNPIEQIWKELRKDFANKHFNTLRDVLNHVDFAVNNLTHDVVKSITCRSWVNLVF